MIPPGKGWMRGMKFSSSRPYFFHLQGTLMTHYIEVAVAREKNPDFVSRMIMRWMGRPYSHIFIIHQNKLIHSTGKGVHNTWLDEFMVDHDIMIKRRVPIGSGKTVAYFKGFVAGCSGKEYSESQYIGFLFPFLRRFFRNGREKTICSEFVANVLNNCCGYDIRNIDFVSPKDVMEYVIEIERIPKVYGIRL